MGERMLNEGANRGGSAGCFVRPRPIKYRIDGPIKDLAIDNDRIMLAAKLKRVAVRLLELVGVTRVWHGKLHSDGIRHSPQEGYLAKNDERAEHVLPRIGAHPSTECETKMYMAGKRQQTQVRALV